MSDEPTVRVVYTKYDGSLHWNHRARPLGEDGHGVWLGCPAGTEARRGVEPPVPASTDYVMLFPRDAWWTASFNAAPHKTEIYCDITTVPSWPDPRTVTMVDLDLDVIRRRRGGRTFLDDADEFAEHQVAYGYPPEVVTAAERSAEWLLSAVRRHLPPFDGSHRHWLRQVA